MKKIKYLSLIILSLLGIGFSYGDDTYTLSNAISDNVLTFEYPTSSKNITYYLYNYAQSYGSTFCYWLNGGCQGVSNIRNSFYTGTYSSILTSDWTSIFTSNLTKSSLELYRLKGFLFLHLNSNTNTYYPDFINYGLIYGNYSTTNGIVSFTDGTAPTFGNTYISQNSYLRAIYSPNVDSNNAFWGITTSPGVIDITDNPYTYQKFKSDTPGFLTPKGTIVIGNYGKLTSITPSLGVGFGFTKNTDGTGITWNDLVLGTVFPYYDSYQSNGNYRLPSRAYTDKFYMFRLNAQNVNSNAGNVGVIAKRDGFYSDLIYSEYNCNLPGNGLTFSTSSKYINLKESCLLVRGGVLHNALPFTNSTGIIRSHFWDSTQSINYSNVNTPYTYFSFSNNNLLAHYYGLYSAGNSAYDQGLSFGTFDDTLVYDILANFSNVEGYVPGTGEEDIPVVDTNYVGDTLDKLCSTMVVKPPYCNNGLDDLGNGLEGFRMIWSGQLQYVVIDTNDSNFSSVNITANGSGSRTVECDTENDYFCSITSNIGSSQTSNFGSGFILSTGYYTDFFIKTGYRAKCPYPYTDWNIGLHNKVLNKVYNALNFDIFLPINCSIAAFTAGRNFQFLKDVNLGLNPLMGNIQGLDDPRNYLYGFFDFLLSLALFFFLMKIYKFFK